MFDDKNALKMWELLPETVRDVLGKTIDLHYWNGKAERLGAIRACPCCGGKNTMDCSRIEGIEDITIGFCLSCGYLWCLECDMSLLTSIRCGHWQVCKVCGEEKSPCGYCGILPWDCLHIKKWLEQNYPTV